VTDSLISIGVEGSRYSLMRRGSWRLPCHTRWVSRFLCRIPDLKKGKSKSIDVNGLTALTPDLVSDFFAQISYLRTKYNIQPQDIYNMDETGFQKGHSRGIWVIFSKQTGPALSSATGTTNWVTIIECISATGLSIKPMVIHPGKCPQDNWWDSPESLPDWLWGFSEKG
jgi:hypothetical protein